MNLTIKQEILKNGISVVERVSQKNLSLPILQNVLVKGEKNFLNLSTTNLEIGIKWWALAKINKEGEITIPTHLFSNIVNFLPNKVIKLEKKDSALTVECENYYTSLFGLEPEEFPIIPILKEGEKISLNSQKLCQGLSQVVDISSPSVARPEISGVYLHFQNNLIKLAATDSFRLAEKKIFQEMPLSKEISLILPRQTAKEILNIFGEKEIGLQVYFSPSQILFESQMTEIPHPQIQISSKLIEGEYPNYEAIIPKKSETQIILPKTEFLNQIKSASLFSGKINEVSFKINPRKGVVEINSQNLELGKYQSEIPAKIKGKEIKISFNHRFLSDGLFQIKTPEVILELTGEEGPAVLKPVGDESYLYVVMPIKAS